VAQKLLDQVSTVARLKHLSTRTEKAYRHQIKRFIVFHKLRHPQNMREEEIRAYLSHLAIDRNVAASTQNVALAALLFLYRDVLKIDLNRIEDIERARLPTRLPVVFTRDEVKAILKQLSSVDHIVASLMYGTGLRLMECLRLRIKDIDFSYNQIFIRSGKGEKDRVTMLPISLKEPLRKHMLTVKLIHQTDLKQGWERCTCLTRSRESIPELLVNGDGNTYFPRGRSPKILARTNCAGITSMKAKFKEPLRMLYAQHELLSEEAVTPYVIALPLIYSKTAMTFVRFRSY
jgi:integrase